MLCHGKVMGIVPGRTVTKEDLGLMMTGSLNLSKEAAEDAVPSAEETAKATAKEAENDQE